MCLGAIYSNSYALLMKYLLGDCEEVALPQNCCVPILSNLIDRLLSARRDEFPLSRFYCTLSCVFCVPFRRRCCLDSIDGSWCEITLELIACRAPALLAPSCVPHVRMADIAKRWRSRVAADLQIHRRASLARIALMLRDRRGDASVAGGRSRRRRRIGRLAAIQRCRQSVQRLR